MPHKTVINPFTGRRIRVGGPTYKTLKRVPKSLRRDPDVLRNPKTGTKHRKGTAGYNRLLKADRKQRYNTRVGGHHKRNKADIAWAKKHAKLMGYKWV